MSLTVALCLLNLVLSLMLGIAGLGLLAMMRGIHLLQFSHIRDPDAHLGRVLSDELAAHRTAPSAEVL